MVKTKKNLQQKNKFPLFKIIPLILVGIYCILAVVFLIRIFQERKPAVESAKTDVKKPPLDVKKTLPEATSSATLKVPILMYHYVEYVQDKRDTIRQSLNINPDIFEQQMKTLKEDGFTFMYAKELGEVLDRKRKLPEKPVLITIDDGHWDVDTDILPVLKKYNIKATIYVIPGFTGGSDFMTEEQIQDLIKSDLIEIGSHTVNHIPLEGKLLQTAHYEITESKKMLEDTFHIPIYSFAYPSGSFDLQAIDVVKKAGYTTAVSTIHGTELNPSNRYFIYRLRPGYRTGPDLINYINSN